MPPLFPAAVLAAAPRPTDARGALRIPAAPAPCQEEVPLGLACERDLQHPVLVFDPVELARRIRQWPGEGRGAIRSLPLGKTQSLWTPVGAAQEILRFTENLGNPW